MLVDGTLRSSDQPKSSDKKSDKNPPSANDQLFGVSQSGQAGLRLLLEAHLYATDLKRSPWDFAVEIASLRRVGLTVSGFRWLVCKEFVEHAREITMPGQQERVFQRQMGLNFSRKTCFVLTDLGVEFVRTVLANSPPAHPLGKGAERADLGTPLEALVPIWDRDRQELRLGGVIVKQFKVPAPNQEVILAAFQEEEWPVRIDDPLPPHPDQDPKRRLHDTINALNRNQKHPLLRFLGDGSGQGVRWDLVRTAGGISNSRPSSRS